MVKAPPAKEMTLGQLKSVVMAQILNNSEEFVEAWKQEYRNKKAQVYQTRQEVLAELATFEKKAPKKDFSGKSNEEIKMALMDEIKEKYNTAITEAWRTKIINDKVATLGNRHQVLNEIAGKKCTKNARKELEPIKVESVDKRADLLADIRKRGNDETREVLPAWKESEMNQKRATFENKRVVLSELGAEKKTCKALNNCDDFVAKRARLMEGIRSSDNSEVVVEAWRQDNREKVANPMILKQQMMNDITTKNQAALKCVKDPRELLLEALNTACDAPSPVEAWKLAINKIRALAIKNKRAIVCDINEKKETIKSSEPNRATLLAAIRQTVTEKSPVSAPVVESWRQTERDAKASLIVAKKMVLVDVEAPKAKALKPVEKSEKTLHAELMSEIRTEKIPAWKEAVNSTRVSAIQGKSAINSEIEAGKPSLKNTKSVQENKISLMKEVRSQGGNFTEAWKEAENNDRATAIGCKSQINHAIKQKSVQLAPTKSQAVLKMDALKELRLQADTTIPLWKEEILNEQATNKGNKHSLVCDITENAKSSKTTLNKTKSFNEVKTSVLAEIRRPAPVEAWKEEQRNEIAQLYTARREVNLDISDKKFLLDCAKSQVQLRDDLLRELRTKNVDFVVPAWKEDKLAKRSQVFANKRELNRCIEKLNLE